jgi:uncharacterized protein YegP (UPF0339 family)
MAGKFEVYEDKAGKFRFRLKAGNGEVVATGEAYETKAAAKNGCKAVQRAADGATIVDLTDCSNSIGVEADRYRRCRVSERRAAAALLPRLGPNWLERRDTEAHPRRLVAQLEKLGHRVTLHSPSAA